MSASNYTSRNENSFSYDSNFKIKLFGKYTVFNFTRSVNLSPVQVSATNQPIDHPAFLTNMNRLEELFANHREILFAGLFLMVAPLLFMYFSIMDHVSFDAMEEYAQFIIIGGIVLRVFSAVWLANIAKEQNRSAKSWILLSVLLPGTAILMMGLTSKLTQPMAYTSQKNTYQQGQAFIGKIATYEKEVALSLGRVAS
jgi:hypothetical protein